MTVFYLFDGSLSDYRMNDSVAGIKFLLRHRLIRRLFGSPGYRPVFLILNRKIRLTVRLI